ncbi:MAG TPA: sugar phosphate nucleotidyltransferase, partial [Thermoanaerobaculia bacterium]|nr:sugar phosphate nucleotidyltransferase [Thermoanaerobaculia bacterium]
MRALVLVAGRGERLWPLTLELPKPLLPVAGRPLVAWTLDRLAALGVAGAALNLHHLGTRIRVALGDGHGTLPLVYSEEAELLGTGGALPPLRAWLGEAERVLVVNGDSLCRWPLAELVARARRTRAPATLLFHRTADPRRFGGGVAVEGGRVVAFRRGALGWETARTRRVFAGAAVLAPELLDRLPEGASDIVGAL